MATRPPDLTNDRWQAALRGLQSFVAGGWADQAEAAGWTRDELFAAPPLWARVDLTGVALMIGDNEVVAVTPSEIRIRTPSGATQAFRRQPAADFGLMFDSRRKQLEGNFAGDSEEPRLRAREATIREFQRLHRIDLEVAKRAVDSIIAEKGNRT